MNFLLALTMGVLALLLATLMAHLLRQLGTLVLSLNSWVIGRVRVGISQAPWLSREQRRKQREKLLSLLGRRPRN